MRIMVLGASGFLGAHVQRQASAAGMEVVPAGRSSPADSARYRRIDLTGDDPARIAKLITDVAPDAVVNCTGATDGAPDALAAANVNGAYGLVMGALLAGTPARLVHIGSAAEYGPVQPNVPMTEQIAPRPAGMYGVTKLAGTRLVELGRAAGLDATVLRVFNPVGPGAPQTGLPGRLAVELRRARGRGSEIRLGSLDFVRDFIDARDFADSVLAAVSAPVSPRPVINIGSGRGVPVRTIVKQLLAISGCGCTVHEDAADSGRTAEIPWQQADITRAREDLAWEPRRDLTTSLTDLWAASQASC